jgi:hypothetical protein
LAQVVQESVGVDFEHREEQANYEHKIRVLSERIAAWRKVAPLICPKQCTITTEDSSTKQTKLLDVPTGHRQV